VPPEATSTEYIDGMVNGQSRLGSRLLRNNPSPQVDASKDATPVRSRLTLTFESPIEKAAEASAPEVTGKKASEDPDNRVTEPNFPTLAEASAATDAKTLHGVNKQGEAPTLSDEDDGNSDALPRAGHDDMISIAEDASSSLEATANFTAPLIPSKLELTSDSVEAAPTVERVLMKEKNVDGSAEAAVARSPSDFDVAKAILQAADEEYSPNTVFQADLVTTRITDLNVAKAVLQAVAAGEGFSEPIAKSTVPACLPDFDAGKTIMQAAKDEDVAQADLVAAPFLDFSSAKAILQAAAAEESVSGSEAEFPARLSDFDAAEATMLIANGEIASNPIAQVGLVAAPLLDLSAAKAILQAACDEDASKPIAQADIVEVPLLDLSAAKAILQAAAAEDHGEPMHGKRV